MFEIICNFSFLYRCTKQKFFLKMRQLSPKFNKFGTGQCKVMERFFTVSFFFELANSGTY
jgi:hypothetical protein